MKFTKVLTVSVFLMSCLQGQASRAQVDVSAEELQAMGLVELVDYFAAFAHEVDMNDPFFIPLGPQRGIARAFVSELHRRRLYDLMDAYLLSAPDNNPLTEANFRLLIAADRTSRDLYQCSIYVCNEWPERQHWRGRWFSAEEMRLFAASFVIEILGLREAGVEVSLEGVEADPKGWLSNVLLLRDDYDAMELEYIERIRVDLLEPRG